jgi:hypothetical protein
VEARTANAGTRQSLQFDIGDIDRHGGDAARDLTEGRQRLEGAGVVEAVAVGLHDDSAREPERALDLQVIG